MQRSVFLFIIFGYIAAATDKESPRKATVAQTNPPPKSNTTTISRASEKQEAQEPASNVDDNACTCQYPDVTDNAGPSEVKLRVLAEIERDEALTLVNNERRLRKIAELTTKQFQEEHQELLTLVDTQKSRLIELENSLEQSKLSIESIDKKYKQTLSQAKKAESKLKSLKTIEVDSPELVGIYDSITSPSITNSGTVKDKTNHRRIDEGSIKTISNPSQKQQKSLNPNPKEINFECTWPSFIFGTGSGIFVGLLNLMLCCLGPNDIQKILWMLIFVWVILGFGMELSQVNSLLYGDSNDVDVESKKQFEKGLDFIRDYFSF